MSTSKRRRSASSWRQVQRSLHNRNFRRYLLGQGVSNTGMWIQQTAELWVILELTGSGAALGLHSVLRFGPVLLLATYGGLIGDRVDRRKLLVLTQGALALAAATLAAVALWSSPTLGLIYAIVLVQGVVNAFDNPLRRAFVRDLTSDEELTNAVSLHSTVATFTRTAGPAVGGVLIAAVGVEWCFVVNALSYGAVLASLAAIDRARLRPSSPVARRRGQLREGFRYAWHTRPIRLTLLFLLVAGVFGWNWNVLLPVYSTDVLGGQAALYGSLVSLLSLGSFIGALLTARKQRLGGRHLLGTGSTVAFALLLVAVAPGMLVAVVALMLLGASGTAFTIGAQTRLQLTAEDAMIGRVMALFSVGFVGARPIGGMVGGWVMDLAGARAAFGAGGLFVTLTAVLMAVEARRRGKAARAGHDPVEGG